MRGTTSYARLPTRLGKDERMCHHMMVGLQEVTPAQARRSAPQSVASDREVAMAVRVVVGILSLIGALLLASAIALVPSAVGAVSGSMIIAGNGPELQTIELLARAFERQHLGMVVEIQWDPYSEPMKLVKSGSAQLAVAGRGDATLTATPIAWDGIAVVVYTGNPTKALTTRQVAALFSGKVKRWTELSGQDVAIQLIDRPQNQHIREGFEDVLGIAGQIPATARLIRSDQKAMSTVAGSMAAVAYASLRPALEAVQYGVDVTLLMVDGVEAAEETVRDGRYKLRRPVLLLAGNQRNSVADAFAIFALSNEGQKIIAERFTPLHVGVAAVR
jgi:phosphate transport system substrate-binding protein